MSTVFVAGWKGVSPTPEYRGLLYMPSLCTGMWGITSSKGIDSHQLATPVAHVSFIHRLYDVHDCI